MTRRWIHFTPRRKSKRMLIARRRTCESFVKIAWNRNANQRGCQKMLGCYLSSRQERLRKCRIPEKMAETLANLVIYHVQESQKYDNRFRKAASRALGKTHHQKHRNLKLVLVCASSKIRPGNKPAKIPSKWNGGYRGGKSVPCCFLSQSNKAKIVYCTTHMIGASHTPLGQLRHACSPRSSASSQGDRLVLRDHG